MNRIEGNIDKIKSPEFMDKLLLIAKEWFLGAFPNSIQSVGGGRTNLSKGGWTSRKKEYSHPVGNDTGNMINSIQIDRYTGILEFTAPYAKYFNEQREFIGKSDELDSIIMNEIEKELNI